MPIINPGTGGGSPGPQGPQGIPGINGIPGFDGESGEDGLSIPGSAGASGSSGVNGRDGIPGSPGEDGLDGLDSFIPGLQGIQGIQGVRGSDGEDGLVNDDFWPGFNPFIDDPLEQISRIQDQNLTIRPNYSAIVVGPYTINPGKKLTIGAGGRFKIEQGAPDTKAIVFAKQTSNFNDTVITEVMAGLGAANSTQVITPKVSGTLLVAASGTIILTVSGGFSTTITVKLYYGTGTPPAAGAAPPASIQVGNSQAIVLTSAPILNWNFDLPVIVQGLITGTAYWFDVSILNTQTGQTIQLSNTNFTAIEL